MDWTVVLSSWYFREFSHWKVNSLATEKRDFFKAPLPLAPEFLRNLRLLGRRPSLQQINENLIKKYGTHFLVSATLGGKQSAPYQIQRFIYSLVKITNLKLECWSTVTFKVTLTKTGSQVAEWLGNRVSNQKVDGLIPWPCKIMLCPWARHFTLLASGKCPCTSCKSLWMRASLNG